MNARPRVSMRALTAAQLPDDPGVYALYHNAKPVYVGKAQDQSLRGRVWGNHRGRGKSMTDSALPGPAMSRRCSDGSNAAPV